MVIMNRPRRALPCPLSSLDASTQDVKNCTIIESNEKGSSLNHVYRSKHVLNKVVLAKSATMKERR